MQTQKIKNKSEPDLLILGAGVAGLSAAAEAARRGLSCLILEARDRIGGRILTVHDPAFSLPVELGAEFIHGHPEETFSQVKAAGLSVFDVLDTHHARSL